MNLVMEDPFVYPPQKNKRTDYQREYQRRKRQEKFGPPKPPHLYKNRVSEPKPRHKRYFLKLTRMQIAFLKDMNKPTFTECIQAFLDQNIPEL